MYLQIANMKKILEQLERGEISAEQAEGMILELINPKGELHYTIHDIMDDCEEYNGQYCPSGTHKGMASRNIANYIIKILTENENN